MFLRWGIFLLLASSLSAAELRTLRGKHLTLHTDLPANRQVDQLPKIFDQAVPQWCKFFGVPAETGDKWQAVGVLMRSPQSRPQFVAAGLLPESMLDFPSGYSQGNTFWMYDQTSDYYRAHLMLHEGTHAFASDVLNLTAPPWYNEGVAELLGTHRWRDDQLQLNVVPAQATDVPKWGRIELVQTEVASGRPLSFAEVIALGPRAHRENVAYAWCWAATALLEHAPRFQKTFRQIPRYLAQGQPWHPQEAQLAELEEVWQMFIADLDYGYDFARMQVELRSGAPLPDQGATIDVAADRSWQSTGLQLQAGKTYDITATGMVQVANGNPPWRSTADGVSIKYIRGQPLGKLFAAIRPDDFDPLNEVTPLAAGIPVGSHHRLTPNRTGTLYLRINDVPAARADNSGTLQVTIKPSTAPPAKVSPPRKRGKASHSS
jgi:hypothetical protein